MQVNERHVLTINKQPVIKRVLDALSAGVKSDGSLPPETRKWLEEFSKKGCDRLILNLRVIKPPFGGTAAAIRNLRICLVGGVLVVTGQVTRPWILLIRDQSRRRFFPRHLIPGFGRLVQT